MFSVFSSICTIYMKFLFSEFTEFTTQWEANPDDTKKNQSFVYYTVGNLKPNTGYRFRIIAWNEVGASDPSEPSNKVFTGQLHALFGPFELSKSRTIKKRLQIHLHIILSGVSKDEFKKHIPIFCTHIKLFSFAFSTIL